MGKQGVLWTIWKGEWYSFIYEYYVDNLNNVTLGLNVQVSGSLSDIVARTEWILLSAYWKKSYRYQNCINLFYAQGPTRQYLGNLSHFIRKTLNNTLHGT